MTGFPQIRPRRLRVSAPLRAMVAETRLHPAELVLPVFMAEGSQQVQEISSMPGVVRHTQDSLRAAVTSAAEQGVGGVMIFGVPLVKDALGAGACDPAGVLSQAVEQVRAEVGDAMVVMADLCLDEFTDHGHCGVLDEFARVDNDATLARYQQMAVVLAQAGVHLVGPSGMMDGQVGAIRAALDAAGHPEVGILAYATKYASAYYGPFREAVASSLQGDRHTYQQDPANVRESLREVALDVAEGADLVMVKPATAYLDVVAAVRAMVTVPVAAYQVSGEYSMIEAAAARGWIDRDRMIMESLTCIKRAGANVILTYWAEEVAAWLKRV